MFFIRTIVEMLRPVLVLLYVVSAAPYPDGVTSLMRADRPEPTDYG